MDRPFSSFAPKIVCLLLFGMVLAGCIGTDEPVPEHDDQDQGPSETTGVLEGQLIDARDFSGISGAQVILVVDDQAAAETKTESDGTYMIGNVQPGVYRVQVHAIGFRGDVRAVEVVAGETTPANFVLEPLPSETPWSEPLDFEGMMGLGYHGVGPTITCCSADSNHQISFAFEVRPDLLETMMIEMFWPEEHVGLRMNVWLNPDCDPACDPDHDYTSHSEDDNLGWGGLEMRIDRPDGGWPKISGDESVELWIYVWADSGEELVTVAYQHQFQIFMENFYVQGAPEGYSVRGDH